LHIFALITLELNHLAHLTIGDDGAIAGCAKKVSLVISIVRMMCVSSLTELLLDNLEDLLLIELLREALNSGQSLTTISLCPTLVVSRRYHFEEGKGRVKYKILFCRWKEE
jgi:hypothetical protein